MDIHDGRDTETLRVGSGGRSDLGCEARRHAQRCGEDHRVDDHASRSRANCECTEGRAADGDDRTAQHGLDSRRLQRACRDGTVKLAQRDP